MRALSRPALQRGDPRSSLRGGIVVGLVLAARIRDNGRGQHLHDVMLPRMFIPWANLLLEAVGIHVGDHVLDVACGPGSVAHLAAARSGSSGYVLGCDLNAAMLDLAAAKTPAAVARTEWRQGSADALPAPSASFDVVTCQQGMQFFPDRPAAMREMHRVLRSGGRLGVAIWASVDKCPPFAAATAAVTEVLGAPAGALYASGPWGWPDPTVIAEVVTAAGFLDVGRAGSIESFLTSHIVTAHT